MGSVAAVVLGSQVADHIGYFASMCVVYYFLKKYIADSVHQLMERSTRSCLFFGAVPLLYYIFDYATTVYTDLLYTGARGAVQFTPSVICTFYLVFVLQYYNESHKQEVAQRERDIFASQLQQAQTELNTMRQMHKGTAIYRHDMRHHLSLIGGFAADGDLKRINEYLAITEADIEALTPVRYCENETVNLILSNFEARAKKKRVDLHADVKLPVDLCMNDTELCSLLSNALENAINAAAQLEDEKLRKVYIHAVINGGKLVISTENAYDGKIEMEGELPKSNTIEAGHGFGIKSMISIVERHGGLYSIETEGGVFTLQLLLPLTIRS
jgi:signal transduction histidine kinase